MSSPLTIGHTNKGLWDLLSFLLLEGWINDLPGCITACLDGNPNVKLCVGIIDSGQTPRAPNGSPTIGGQNQAVYPF